MRKKIAEYVLERSLRQALSEQRLSGLAGQLSSIVGDLSGQYTNNVIDSRYRRIKTRGLHAFQISLVKKAFSILGTASRKLNVVDIGDSAGTHLRYINHIFADRDIRVLGVNIDPLAVAKIKKQGLEAICSRAEDLFDKYSVDADLFLSFEMLEHLMDPVGFLYDLSHKTACGLFVVTVPFVAASRVGLHHLRRNREDMTCAENTHIFEFSPKDWKLLFKFCGWRVVFEKTYRQYPLRHWLRLTKYCWRRADFEGFWGVVLERDHSWSCRYKDWRA